MEEFLFPHEKIREVQEDFIRDVANSLQNNKHMIIHAPTGLGKTTILGPALAHAIKNRKTVFFITPMHTQHKIAVETLRKIKEKYKIKFIGVDFIGKRWMCQQKGIDSLNSSEFGEYCKDMIDHGTCFYYNNIKKKDKISPEAEELLKELEKKAPLNVEELIKLSGENKLCPFEISSLLAQTSHALIVDYHHILNPSIREALLTRMNKNLNECILIFDEAHNLPEKSRDMLTVSVSNISIDYSAKECKSLGYEELARSVNLISEILEKFSRQKTDMETQEALITKEEFYEEITKIDDYEKMMGSLSFAAEQILETKQTSSSYNLALFMEQWLGTDEGFARILKKGFTKQGKSYITLMYRCLDPSMLIKPIAEEALIITMSGTLSPTSMYRDLFGIDAEIKEYRDVFPKQNRLNLLIPKTTTKFTERNSEMYNKIAVVTSKLSNAFPGNVAIFFPSYNLLSEVKRYFKEYSDKTILSEVAGISKKERQEILESFKSYKEMGAVLLGCSSGSFGEGIDLPGEYLKGVIVVGLPLSKPDLEIKKLIEYYDKKFKKGNEYGYIFPAILKTIQNAGRCIRSKNDKGVRIFVDERYVWPMYLSCFPKEWEMVVTNMPITAIENFFKKPL